MLFTCKEGRYYSNVRYKACDSNLYLPVDVDAELPSKILFL